MFFSRPFLRLARLAAVCLAWSGVSPLAADEVIRILAGNLTSGTGQNYDPGEGNRILQGLNPDIVMVQEFNYLNNTTANFRSWVDMNFGTTFSYARETVPGNIPNGIVSRYPILASGEWNDSTLTDRDFMWAKIDIPGDKNLWVISVHLKASTGTDNVTQRNTQAGAILDYIAANVPAADYLAIGGDFNTYSRTEACITTLSAEFVTAGPWPVDQANDGDTNSGRSEPYDWVIPDADLNARKTPLVIGANSFTNGLVFDSRKYTPLSDVSPVLSTDSGATGMQHMAVMRAFLIPTNAAPTIASAANSSSTETVTDLDSAVYEIVRGTSVGLSVTGADDGGEAALKYTWSLASGPGSAVAFSANATNAAKNCTAAFQVIGNYTLTATIQDAAGLSVASSVKIRVVQAAGSLALNPPSATLAVGTTLSFTATLLDQFTQPMASQPASFTWTSGGGGTFNASGVFTATTAGGPFVLTAAGGGFSDTSSVTVTKGTAVVSLSNLTQTYTGSPKPATVTTSPANLAVSVLYSGSATVPTNAGNYTVTAAVTNPNYQGSASGTLIISPDEWALWKNTHFASPEQSAGLAADPADPDADGLCNLAEYALGSNPRQFTAPNSGVLDAGGFSLTFTRPANLPGIHYAAETSGNLGIWSPVPLEILTTGAVETVRARVASGADPAIPHFLRLRVERQ